MAIKICRDCKKEFEQKYNYNPKYRQKYCDKCSKQRKKDYANIYSVNAEDCEDDD